MISLNLCSPLAVITQSFQSIFQLGFFSDCIEFFFGDSEFLSRFGSDFGSCDAFFVGGEIVRKTSETGRIVIEYLAVSK